MQIFVWKRILPLQQVGNSFSYFSALLLTVNKKSEKRNKWTWSIRQNFVWIFLLMDFANMVTDANTCTKWVNQEPVILKHDQQANNHTARWAQRGKALWRKKNSNTEAGFKCWNINNWAFFKRNNLINARMCGDNSRIKGILNLEG